MRKIGIIHTPFKKDEDIPHQTYKSEEKGVIEVFEKYEKGLKDIEEFSHIIAIYEFHENIKKSVKEDYYLKTQGLLVKPYLDNEIHGVFSTKSPNRPNPIGISIVKLLKVSGNMLEVKGVDILDKTPLLDIKPYVPEFDEREDVKTGWLKNKV